jgi:succinate dehydrogenase / fumarate reductase flavoprotein subunit
MLTVSTCAAQGAINRKESRGGHTRDDFPKADPEMGRVNMVQRQSGAVGYLNPISVTPEPIGVMPDELKELFEEGK